MKGVTKKIEELSTEADPAKLKEDAQKALDELDAVESMAIGTEAEEQIRETRSLALAALDKGRKGQAKAEVQQLVSKIQKMQPLAIQAMDKALVAAQQPKAAQSGEFSDAKGGQYFTSQNGSKYQYSGAIRDGDNGGWVRNYSNDGGKTGYRIDGAGNVFQFQGNQLGLVGTNGSSAVGKTTQTSGGAASFFKNTGSGFGENWQGMGAPKVPSPAKDPITLSGAIAGTQLALQTAMTGKGAQSIANSLGELGGGLMNAALSFRGSTPEAAAPLAKPPPPPAKVSPDGDAATTPKPSLDSLQAEAQRLLDGGYDEMQVSQLLIGKEGGQEALELALKARREGVEPKAPAAKVVSGTAPASSLNFDVLSVVRETINASAETLSETAKDTAERVVATAREVVADITTKPVATRTAFINGQAQIPGFFDKNGNNYTLPAIDTSKWGQQLQNTDWVQSLKERTERVVATAVVDMTTKPVATSTVFINGQAQIPGLVDKNGNNYTLPALDPRKWGQQWKSTDWVPSFLK